MAKNQPSRIAKTVKYMLAIILLVAASVGATLFYSSTMGSANAAFQTSEPEPQPLAKPIFTPLDPFTVTLRTEHSNRILYVAITLRLEDETSRRQIVEFMPEVRDRVLRTLSEQDASRIQTQDGRAQLVQLINDVLERPYHPEPTGPRINSVLFTAFVIQ